MRAKKKKWSKSKWKHYQLWMFFLDIFVNYEFCFVNLPIVDYFLGFGRYFFLERFNKAMNYSFVFMVFYSISLSLVISIQQIWELLHHHSYGKNTLITFPSPNIVFPFDLLAKIEIAKFSYSRWNCLCVFILCIVFNVTNINSIHKHEGGNESSWCSFFKALSDLLISVAYCFNVKDLVANLFCICTIVLLAGKIWWVFYVCVL